MMKYSTNIDGQPLPVNQSDYRGLTRGPHVPIPSGISRLDGRSGKDRKVAGEESPGSTDVRCRITSGGREPRESATENRPPADAKSYGG